LQSLIDEKLSLIDAGGNPRAKRKAFRRLKEINRILFEKAAPAFAELSRRLKEATLQAERNEVLGRRDYPFCVYPRGQLEGFLAEKIGRIG
jgi:hypothetical protein